MRKKILNVCFTSCLTVAMLFSSIDAYAGTASNKDLAQVKAFKQAEIPPTAAVDELLEDERKIGKQIEENEERLEIEVTNENMTDNRIESKALLERAPRAVNNFSWNYNTDAFNPNSTTATNDIDILWNQYVNGNFMPQFDLLDTGIGSMPAKKLFGSTSSEYIYSVNEGRVNDYIGYHMPHQYYVTLSSKETFTFFLGSKVRAVVFTDNGELCLDTGYNSNGDYLSTQAFQPTTIVNQVAASAFGSNKTVIYLAVPAGNYYIAFLPYNLNPVPPSNVDTLDNAYHYAFYAGNALPQQKQLFAPINLGTVNSYLSTSNILDNNKITLNADALIRELYAVKYVRVDNASYRHENNRKTEYRYISPAQTNYNVLNQYFMVDHFSTPGYLEDQFPVPGSIIGTWRFYLTHTIYPQPFFSQDGILRIDYFVPFGLNI